MGAREPKPLPCPASGFHWFLCVYASKMCSKFHLHSLLLSHHDMILPQIVCAARSERDKCDEMELAKNTFQKVNNSLHRHIGFCLTPFLNFSLPKSSIHHRVRDISTMFIELPLPWLNEMQLEDYMCLLGGVWRFHGRQGMRGERRHAMRCT